MRKPFRLLLTACAAMLTLAAGSAPARADTSTCTYGSFLGIGFVVVQVTDTGPFDPQGVAAVNGQIRRYNDGQVLDPCGAATTSNTEFITINDTAPSSSSSVDAVILFENGALAPGQADEPGSSDEIEITANLGAGQDRLTHLASSAPGAVRIGRSGNTRTMNLNAFEKDGLDPDVTLNGVESVTVRIGSPSSLGAAGGFATGGPFDGRVQLSGGISQDQLVGGPLSDRLFGHEANDRMAAGAGRDQLFGEDGPDKLRGQAGNDLIAGGDGDDLLVGGKGKDRCFGGDGKDKFRSCEVLVSP